MVLIRASTRVNFTFEEAALGRRPESLVRRKLLLLLLLLLLSAVPLTIIASRAALPRRRGPA